MTRVKKIIRALVDRKEQALLILCGAAGLALFLAELLSSNYGETFGKPVTALELRPLAMAEVAPPDFPKGAVQNPFGPERPVELVAPAIAFPPPPAILPDMPPPPVAKPIELLREALK